MSSPPGPAAALPGQRMALRVNACVKVCLAAWPLPPKANAGLGCLHLTWFLSRIPGGFCEPGKWLRGTYPHFTDGETEAAQAPALGSAAFPSLLLSGLGRRAGRLCGPGGAHGSLPSEL